MTELYDGWRPLRSQATPLDNWVAYCPLAERSPPISLAGNSDRPVTLPMFQSTSSLASSAAASSAVPSDDARDVLLHVGGPVWGMDWCPAELAATRGDGGPSPSSKKASEAKAAQFLAVGCHPAGGPPHRIGAAVQGPSVIQVWELHGLAGCSSKDQVPLPRMALGVAHMGGLTWHCRWCPSGELADSPDSPLPEGVLPRLGLLAAALGDGTVQIWAVPDPRAVPPPEGGSAEQPRVVLLHPVAALSSAQLGGSMPALVDWMPVAPYDQLLIGCWDGSVAVAKLNPLLGDGLGQAQYAAAAAAAASAAAIAAAAQAEADAAVNTSNAAAAAAVQLRAKAEAEAAAALAPSPPQQPLGMYLVAHFPCDMLPLRAAKWLPPMQPSVDLAHRHTFLTAGHEGTVKIWDARDQFQPAYAQQLTTTTVLDAAWTALPLGIMAAMEDGSLRGILLASASIEEQLGAGKPTFQVSFRGTNVGALWAVDTHPVAQVVAYAGEDGVVGLTQADFKWDHRKRRPHLALAALRDDGAGGLTVLCEGDLERGGGGLYVDRLVERAPGLVACEGEIPDESQAVHRLAWAPQLSGGGAAWLAAGGGSGVVRCLWVTTRGL